MKPSRKILFIVGMHRSGTSALCSALAASGATFGSSLLQPMSGVNDEGFWEDGELVELNEQLLHKLDTHWYTASPDLATVDWSGELFSDQRQQAMAILNRGFGDGVLEVAKDPRLCVTLPFWLSLCETLQIATSVCVINRAPLEIARSLEKRDGFPIGYGLRLYSSYRRLIATNVSSNAEYIRYDQLLVNPGAVMQQLAQSLPLSPQEEQLVNAVRSDLKHHSVEGKNDILSRADSGDIDLAVLDAAIEDAFPWSTTVAEFSCALVHANKELTRVGDEHTLALATLSERDATLEAREAALRQLGVEHSQAQATIDERDGQIAVFDQRLTDIGNEHSHALGVIAQKDQQLEGSVNRANQFEAQTQQAELKTQQVELRIAQMEARLTRIFKLPGIGFVFRKLWFYESR